MNMGRFDSGHKGSKLERLAQAKKVQGVKLQG